MNDSEEIVEQNPLMDALAYPARGSGLILLVIGAVLSAVLGLVNGKSIFGGISGLCGLAYFNAYYFDIVENTVSGNDEPPDWPDVSDLLDEMILPFVRMIGTLMISSFPLMIIIAFDHDRAGLWSHPLVWLGLAWAAFYFPMAMLNVIVSNQMIEAMPHEVLPRILRAMPGYLVIAGLLAAGMLISWLMTKALHQVPIAGGLLAAAGGFYFAMAQARLAGSFYRKHLEEDEAAEVESTTKAGVEEK